MRIKTTTEIRNAEGGARQYRAALERMPLFSGADLDSIEGLLDSCSVRELQAGEILIEAGKPNRTLYLLLSGRLRIHLDSLDNQPVCLLEVGESVGELSVIDQKPTSAFVVADAPSRALEVDHDLFWALVNASHAIASNMLVTLAQRLRANNSAVVESLELQRLYKRHATIDQLTGLHNRRWLDDVLPRQMKRSSMNASPLSIMMVDVDHFKKFNDNFGHLAGDQVLYAVAQAMLKCVRPTDMLARFGGEEFVAILTDTDVEGARIVAERIRQSVADTTVKMSDASQLPSVTVSLGLAQMASFASVETLLTAADEALYRAKAKGRNCFSE